MASAEPYRLSYNQQYIEPQKQLDEPWTWSEYNRKLEIFASRVEGCKFMEWSSLVCPNCKNIVKPNVVKMSCMSPFCKDQECIRNKKRIALIYFNNLKITSKNLLHFIIGFPHVEKFTKEIRKQQQKVLTAFTIQMKKLGSSLRCVKVRDIEGVKGDLYVHYHFGNLPVKDYRIFHRNLNKARELVSKRLQTPFIVKSKHYRNKKGLWRYFSHRIAGVFGDLKNNQSYGYQDLMDLKEFFDTIYNSRSLSIIGLRRPEGASNLAFMIDNFPAKCQFCGEMHLKIIPNSMIEKPPDKICKSCYLLTDSRDWNYSRGCCVYCTSDVHSISYPSAKENHRSKFILKKLSEDHSELK